jgi:hypothetical protein
MIKTITSGGKVSNATRVADERRLDMGLKKISIFRRKCNDIVVILYGTVVNNRMTRAVVSKTSIQLSVGERIQIRPMQIRTEISMIIIEFPPEICIDNFFEYQNEDDT